jgi:tetratricopeptide (TPR) repeat protein
MFQERFLLSASLLIESMKNVLSKIIRIILPIVLVFSFSCAKDAAFYNDRGIASYQKGQYDLAIAYYNGALEINPRHAKAYNNRGGAYHKKGQDDQAISDYNKALEIDPWYASAYNNRGNAYGKRGQYDEAISDYNKALEISPRLTGAYLNRGNAYHQKGQHDLAIADYTKALEIDPWYAEAYNVLAWLLATAKEPRIRNGEKAVELALRACELTDWKNPVYLDTLAAAYARVDDFSNAIKWQEEVLKSPEIYKHIYKQDEARGKLDSYRERLKFYQQHKPWPSD